MVDDCAHCEEPRVAMTVPDALSAHSDSDAVACCPRCLRVSGCEPPAEPPDFESIHPRFPTGDGGVAVVLLLGKLESLALNSAAIDSLVEFCNTAGVDLFLAIDRLLEAENISPAIDLSRRRDQLLDRY